MKDNFNIYDLNRATGEYKLLKDGSEDQPNLKYEYSSKELEELIKNISS